MNRVTLLFLSIFISFAYSNPMLSYLDDIEEVGMTGTSNTSVFEIIFNILFWIAIFAYFKFSDKTENNDIQKVNDNFSKFQILIDRLLQQNKKLGECLKNNVSFISLENGILTLHSKASKEDRIFILSNFDKLYNHSINIFGNRVRIIKILA